MRSATAATASVPLERAMAQAEPRIHLSDRNETLLKIDLSDLVLPKVNDLHVDGLKRSWLSRLFSRH
jgi:hypothetical protein